MQFHVLKSFWIIAMANLWKYPQGVYCVFHFKLMHQNSNSWGSMDKIVWLRPASAGSGPWVVQFDAPLFEHVTCAGLYKWHTAFQNGICSARSTFENSNSYTHTAKVHGNNINYTIAPKPVLAWLRKLQHLQSGLLRLLCHLDGPARECGKRTHVPNIRWNMFQNFLF